MQGTNHGVEAMTSPITGPHQIVCTMRNAWTGQVVERVGPELQRLQLQPMGAAEDMAVCWPPLYHEVRRAGSLRSQLYAARSTRIHGRIHPQHMGLWSSRTACSAATAPATSSSTSKDQSRTPTP